MKEDLKKYVVSLDINGVNIYSANYYVVAVSSEEAIALVYGWAQGHYYNSEGTEVREATEEESVSSKYWR